MAIEHRQFRYRADLDGLRAFAVLGVLIFHLSPRWMPGGFMAVDYFFVLSGFLMGSIVDQELKIGHFSLRRFFERRVRRLFPALISILVFCLLVGYFILTPRAYQDLGRSILSVSINNSNVYFWLKSGYFEQASELKPLLHTWSLGVEEQFYLAFPFFMLFLRRFDLDQKIKITFLSTFLSFALCVWSTQSDPSFAFYLSFSRVWELGLGLLSVFVLQKDRVKQWVDQIPVKYIDLIWSTALLGLILIYLRYPIHLTFPSYYPLLPCLLVLIIIILGDKISFSLWTHPVLIHIGKISYSVYLWHWPLISFSHSFLMRDLTLVEKIILFVLSLLLGHLSFRLIEKPMQGTKRFFSIIGTMIFCGLLGFALHAFDGLQSRFSGGLEEIFNVQNEYLKLRKPCYQANVAEIREGKICTLGIATEKYTQPPQYLLWGDSHADSARFGLDESLKMHQQKGLVLSKSSCPAMLDVWIHGDEKSQKCQKYLYAMLDYLRTQPQSLKNVILVGRWALFSIGSRVGHEPGQTIYLLDEQSKDLPLSTNHNLEVMMRGLSQMIERLHALNKEIYLLYPNPEFPMDVPQYLGMALHYRDFFKQEIYQLPVSEVIDRQRRVKRLFDYLKKHYPYIHIIETQNAFCHGDFCPIASPQLEPYYYDQHHLSAKGSELLTTPIFNKIILNQP